MIPVVDIFAGPGGLNEGFSRIRRADGPVFDVAASFEMEWNAVQTLAIRSAIRRMTDVRDSALPGAYRDLLTGRKPLAEALRDEDFGSSVELARKHIHHVELGPARRQDVADRIKGATANSREWVLIGGPPCQAYSLVGRARRTKDETFVDDKKHFLYREYLDILQRFEPPIFVMENVKGLLSAGHSGRNMMQRITDDLRLGGTYEIRSLVVEGENPEPRDFVVHAEDYGVPQRRHRIILLGVRKDLGVGSVAPLVREERAQTVYAAIGDLPPIRARVTRTTHQEVAWLRARELGRALAHVEGPGPAPRAKREPAGDELRRWLTARQPSSPSQHEPRAHMESDLARYAYLATLAERGSFPRVADLPLELMPRHRNVQERGTPFSDRFKVQTWDRPSSTVVSHMCKDGHYFIHPDADQMRSLTVREAARLQTFPDDYWFHGPRTMQYHQVGNAVPPLLAFKIAERVAQLLGR